MRITIYAATALVGLAGHVFAGPAVIPAAVVTDPPANPDHLPRMILSAMPTHGIHIPALFYTAADSGKHPTVVLLTGMPGAEINSDLIYAIRRAGWNVVAFHYRGSWGSGGTFSIAHCIQDAEAAVSWLHHPDPEIAPFVDPPRIVVMGHSFGGWLALYTAAHDRRIMGVASFSAADLAIPPGTPHATLVHYLGAWVRMKDMLLLNTTVDALATEATRDGPHWDVATMATPLARHPLLMVSANDGLGAYDKSVADAVAKQPGAKVSQVHFDTNHGYNDRRIALAGALVSWLQGLPGAPQ